jgi:hypothetical protein
MVQVAIELRCGQGKFEAIMAHAEALERRAVARQATPSPPRRKASP